MSSEKKKTENSSTILITLITICNLRLFVRKNNFFILNCFRLNATVVIYFVISQQNYDKLNVSICVYSEHMI